MSMKREAELNLEICQKLLDEIKYEIKGNANYECNEEYLNYNSSLVKRNRIVINRCLKELELY